MTNFNTPTYSRTQWLWRTFCAATIALCLHACVKAPQPKPVVSVSIEPERALLEQIAGDRLEVRSLMAKGGNPESYEPSFSHLANLRNSLAYFRMGNLGFESAILEKVMAGNPDLPIYCVSDSICLIAGTHGHSHSHADEHADGHAHETQAYDPHTWTSVKNARIIAANMLRGLKEVDPANADYYTANFIRLTAGLDSLDAALTRKLEPHRGETFVVWHPSLSYFARDYGLHQLSLGDENKEPSVAMTRSLIDSARASGARVMFLQQDFDRSRVQSITDASASGEAMRTVTINPLSPRWADELTAIADAIAQP